MEWIGWRGFGEVASDEWRVASRKKKQIPRCARNDNSRGFRQAEAMAGLGRVVGLALVAGWPASSRQSW